ncbi:PadR family transcriptional regulator [Actinorugispora endophytica]|uniref:DNA-binding PadR family transcriptional regulator n=1 Tax=Actinorugispora endophytica TaxID=1605990 RepID=A0A4R6V408_9ACTN|nr:PadR family transcriptional regulator [Actinorugispora endophytica]TDQ53572.1 DNA-binding PadR family transcriptional regulator [Actinorugispora endophytica]
MSTIFGHGRLRLYLLKLLDESPRHGYEIISLLRDRFLGVYSPSPGTIYPRLARLEEEGLVTHEEVNGRKVYRLTDKGRAELRSRSGDLDDLERELTESVRDVARAVQQDVRDTISHLREELKFAARGTRRGTRSDRTGQPPPADAGTGDVWGAAAEEARAGDPKGGGGAPGKPGGTGEREREHGGSWWEREKKFAYGFGWGTWGKGTGKECGGERADFDRTLHDFADRVRDVAREAGHVGEAAVTDLRRILDETVEVIRRDAAGWGPAGSETTAKPSGDTSETGGGAEGPPPAAEEPPGPSAGPSADTGGGAPPPADPAPGGEGPDKPGN